MKKIVELKNIYLIDALLKKQYNDYNHSNKSNPLNELIYIILSIQTPEKSYQDAYIKFKHAFPKFTDILNSTPNKIERVIKQSGLSKQRSIAINKSVSHVNKKFRKSTLAPLKKCDDKEAEEFLTTLPRVGTKVARCIMMYSLNRQVFPVDTHIWRISRRLGWVRKTRKDSECRTKDMDRLQDKIPPELRYSLHVNMVSLGREICTARNPKCNICSIEKYCKKIGVNFH